MYLKLKEETKVCVDTASLEVESTDTMRFLHFLKDMNDLIKPEFIASKKKLII